MLLFDTETLKRLRDINVYIINCLTTGNILLPDFVIGRFIVYQRTIGKCFYRITWISNFVYFPQNNFIILSDTYFLITYSNIKYAFFSPGYC